MRQFLLKHGVQQPKHVARYQNGRYSALTAAAAVTTFTMMARVAIVPTGAATTGHFAGARGSPAAFIGTNHRLHTPRLSPSPIFQHHSQTRNSRLFSTPGAPKQYYVLRYKYVPDVLEKRTPHRAKHLALAQELANSSKCAGGGPIQPVTDATVQEVPSGAIFLFDSYETCEQFVNADPYVSAGIVMSHSVDLWTVGVAPP
jgi:uncharacterized protein